MAMKGGVSHAPSILAVYCGVEPSFIRDGHYMPHVFQRPNVYAYEDVFLCCPNKGQSPPRGFAWVHVATVHNRKIFSAVNHNA